MRKVYIVSLALLLQACVTSQNYLYVPPQNAEGRQCVEACSKTQEACLVEEERSLAECEKQYRFDQRLYGDCGHANGTGQHIGCIEPQFCAPPNTIKCLNAYNICYETCGGDVVPE
ncbi:MAG: hypothetical protein AAF569_05495 [Pseudomonadota bacterium]